MNFYRDCFGGEIFFQTVGESPMAEKMPEKMKAMILHASLNNGPIVIMGSDMVPDGGLVRGNAVSLSLMCDSAEEMQEAFAKLSDGGVVRHAIETTFFGGLLGGLTDKFGNHWLLFHEPKN
jgi:PhnB protein